MQKSDPTLSVTDLDLDKTEGQAPPRTNVRLVPQSFVGDYEILSEIAQGGMGVVYKARHAKLNRIVALKMSRAGDLASSKETQRFQGEAEAAAKLDHPNIVPIFEVGEFDGRRFFSMAFVEGESLSQATRDGPLPPRRAAEIMKHVADGVAYAHDQGVIHRDIKPGNILLDPSGQPRVTDFGLAKLADADSSLTQAGQVMGTPSFMPPEQAEGKNDQVGPLADVYALGATLYALITGRPPFQSASVVETLKQVVERQPAAPHLLNPAVGRDLDTICLKCLEKRPEKRYASASAMADDLQRFLDNRTILARPVGDVEKLIRWGKRNKAVSASLAGIVAIFLLAFIIVSRSYVLAENARNEEAIQRQAADSARDEAERKEKEERWGRYRSNIAAASGALQLHNSGTARRALEDAPEEHRNWEWRHLYSQLDSASLVISVPGGKIKSFVLNPSGRQAAVCCVGHNDVYLVDVATGKQTAVLRGHTAPATSVIYRRDGGEIATAGEDQTVRLWDPATGIQKAVLKHKTAAVDLDQNPTIAYNADGSRIVSASEDNAGAVRLWDPVAGTEIAVLAPWIQRASSAAFSPDGKRIAVGAGEFAHLCDAADGRRIAAMGPHARPLLRVAFSPDGKRIASVTIDGANDIHLWDGETGQAIAVLKAHKSHVGRVQFSPDSSRLISAGNYPDNASQLWNAADGKLIAPLVGHTNGMDSIVFSPDGGRIATASLDQTAMLWDGRTASRLATMSGHNGAMLFVLFSPNGSRIVTMSVDSTLRLWHGQTGELIAVLRGHADSFENNCPPIFTPDGSRLISGSRDGTLRVWDMNLLERNGILRGHTSYVYDVAFHPLTEEIASVAWDGTARLWNPTAGSEKSRLDHDSLILISVSYSRDGRWMAVAERERGVVLWNLQGPKPRQQPQDDFRFRDPGSADSRTCLSPDSKLLASGTLQGPVRLWDLAAGGKLTLLNGHTDRSIDVAFHPGGRLLASSGADGTIRFWDAVTRSSIGELRGHSDLVARVDFSHDGKLLASGSQDRTVGLWDVETRKLLQSIPAGDVIYGVAFSPDGTRLAAACRDNTIRIIDVARRQQVAELRGHSGYVHAVAWSPDGSRLVSGGAGDFSVRIWDSLSVQERARK